MYSSALGVVWLKPSSKDAVVDTSSKEAGGEETKSYAAEQTARA
jgi:hypothetical protein